MTEPQLETVDDSYSWLSAIQAVSYGSQSGMGWVTTSMIWIGRRKTSRAGPVVKGYVTRFPQIGKIKIVHVAVRKTPPEKATG